MQMVNSVSYIWLTILSPFHGLSHWARPKDILIFSFDHLSLINKWCYLISWFHRYLIFFQLNALHLLIIYNNRFILKTRSTLVHSSYPSNLAMFLFSILPLPKLCSWAFSSALFVTLFQTWLKKGGWFLIGCARWLYSQKKIAE
jgi:hypothetical protein